MRKGVKDMARRNEEVAAVLEDIGWLLALKRDNPFRVRAYYEAGRRIAAMREDIDDLRRQGRLEDIPGVGKVIARLVNEYLSSGRLDYYDDLQEHLARLPVGVPRHKPRAA